jgi:hypothetical protein
MTTALTEINGKLYAPQPIAAEFCGVIPQTLGNWAKQGNPPPRDPITGLYPLKELGEWSRNRQIYKTGRGGGLPFMPKISNADSDAPTPALNGREQEARYKKLQGDRLELEMAERAGKLVLAEDVTAAWLNIVARVKMRLRGIPTKLAPLVHGAKDVYTVQQTLEDGVAEALDELSEDWVEADDDETQ